jgi:hypothetical protein
MGETDPLPRRRAHDEPAVTLDAFLGQTNATAVRLEPATMRAKLIPHLDRLR